MAARRERIRAEAPRLEESRTLVVLLRGINVGGAKRLPMATLRDLLADLDARDVITYLQSGQAVVRLPPDDADDFAARVHDAVQDRLGLDVSVLTRTPAELAAIAAANAYPHLVATPKRLHVVFLDRTPDAEQVAVVGHRHGDDELTVGDRVLYLAFSASSHDSPLLPALRRIGGVQTARNWTTMLKLIELTTPA
jgi:uncharacterized protein (DUF1697 family)